MVCALHNTTSVSFKTSNHKCTCRYFLFIFLWSAWWWLPSLAETRLWFYL